jgi:TRAP-type C4-dicarboxylate transport system permease small subunit
VTAFSDRLVAVIADLPSPRAFILVGCVGALLAAAPVFAARDVPAVQRVRRAFGSILATITAAVLLVMVVLSGLQILLRNAAESGLLWIDPFLRHLVLFLTCLGALQATSGKRHLQINVLGRLLRGAAHRVVGAMTALLGTGICLALTHASLGLVAEEIPTGDLAFSSVPTWMVVCVLPVAFFGMALRMALLVLEEAAGVAPSSETEGVA